MEEIAEAIIALKWVDWSIGVAAFAGALGDRVWVGSGRDGENLISAEGSTTAEA